jgi:endonuclease/exonuclease/phosphatase family metal-dependent hydrolase
MKPAVTDYPEAFNLCTLNLFNYIAPPNAYYEIENIYSQSTWEKKQSWISRQIEMMAPDIMGFQEVFSPKELEVLTAEQGLPYFVTVEEPGLDVDHIYNKPVVALASKYPIVSAEQVPVSAKVISDIGLQDDFSFSRPVIRAEVKINGFTTILVYVAHLKSKRSRLEHIRGDEDEASYVTQSVLAQVQGSWASSIQRGTEAALIHADIVAQMQISKRPVVVMGDFNDGIESAPLQSLIGGQKMDRLNGKITKHLPIEDQRVMQQCSLFDAFELQEYHEEMTRKATHYFANRGNVLDYILLSSDFNDDYDHSLASVESVEVFDKHLTHPDHVDDLHCSDHAGVKVNIDIRF